MKTCAHYANLQSHVPLAAGNVPLQMERTQHSSITNRAEHLRISSATEKLVEIGLAKRGSSIPLEEVLSILSLKDLNEISNNPEKQFKRKNLAIEYILSIPNIEEKIGFKISFRELFQLIPLPEKFSGINLNEISNAWRYTSEVVQLLVGTYQNASYSTRLSNDKYLKEYKVECYATEDMCPRAKEFMNKKYPKSRPPKIPFHIGCMCQLREEYDFN